MRRPCTTSWSPFPPRTREVQFDEKWAFVAKKEANCDPTDPGGVRRLLRVPMVDDEDLVCVMVHCPSTGGRYLLRVPPKMKTCRQAVAWTAGFDDPSRYRPLVEA
jgi:hypothetical protein